MTEEFHKQPTSPGVFASEKPSAAPSIPQVIGPYKIENLLEKGGMSLLYLGTHPETKEPTTIKVLSARYLSHPEVIKSFTNEAEIIAMTNHPNIVQLYGHGEWEGGLYIAMEFIQGISLRQYILQNPISLNRALEIIIDIAYALCHLHSHGVVHRDLKPENILITESGEIKVIDFGIAQVLTEGDTSHGQHQLIGTPVYMSPEQRDNPAAVSFPSDIYSLGIISYELILGKLSHGQIHLSMMPRGVQKLLHRMLLPNAIDRYQDIVDVIADFSNYKNSVTLQKDKKVGDPISEMAENMKRAQLTLLTSFAPQWPGMEIGLAGHQGISLSGVYYDFLELPENTYGIIMGEASSHSAEGVIYTGVLRGMVRALCRLTTKPIELVTILNDILFRDSMNQEFALNYLIIDPNNNQLRYISCGYGNLWHLTAGAEASSKISTTNPPLGVSQGTDFTEVSAEWHPGDTLILNTFSGLSEELFEAAVAESRDLPPQKQVEAILRKLRTAYAKSFQDRSISLVSVLRKVID
ncbi:MAG: protein kinase [Parachlamydiaceae bacterium]|nr:protein kinase [Parachlamydiaceae bacterium]